MDLSEFIQPGLVREDSYIVEEDQSAIHVGSGSLRVLATPWMIAFMEKTARLLLGERLPAGYSSVGAHVDVRHLAPSAVGARVRVRAEVLAVDGLKVSFAIQAWDEQEQIGAGQHLRVVIEEERFLRRISAKLSKG